MHYAYQAFALRWQRSCSAGGYVYNIEMESMLKAQNLQTFVSLSYSEHNFGERSSFVATLTNSGLRLPSSQYICQIETSWAGSLSTFLWRAFTSEKLYSKTFFYFFCDTVIIAALLQKKMWCLHYFSELRWVFVGTPEEAGNLITWEENN